MKTYETWQRTASYLLPPSPRDWLPEDHLVYFLLDLLGQLDLSVVEDAVQARDARGTRPYPPAMMVVLLLYGYCVGVFSSRKLEKATYEDVAFRVLTVQGEGRRVPVALRREDGMVYPSDAT